MTGSPTVPGTQTALSKHSFIHLSQFFLLYQPFNTRRGIWRPSQVLPASQGAPGHCGAQQGSRAQAGFSNRRSGLFLRKGWRLDTPTLPQPAAFFRGAGEGGGQQRGDEGQAILVERTPWPVWGHSVIFGFELFNNIFFW